MASQLAWLALCAVLAQTGETAPSIDHAALNRIRGRLRAPTLTIPRNVEGPPRYRVLVEGRQLRLKLPWDGTNDTIVPPYVRPGYVETHYEFLRTTTPEAWHASTLYVGVEVLGPGASLIKAIKRSAQNRQAAAIRRQIAEEVRQIQEANGPPQ